MKAWNIFLSRVLAAQLKNHQSINGSKNYFNNQFIIPWKMLNISIC